MNANPLMLRRLVRWARAASRAHRHDVRTLARALGLHRTTADFNTFAVRVG